MPPNQFRRQRPKSVHDVLGLFRATTVHDVLDPDTYYLEEVATEFDTQGLELDWIGVVWDADLRYANEGWTSHSFKGTAWQNVNNPIRRRYLKNAYRVLLTRARQGVIIVVPDGSVADPTRKPEYYDGTFNYLRQIGFEVIE